MKLIITDFDGTLYDDNYFENIKFLECIKKDYDIVIATGRNYNSLKKNLKICTFFRDGHII